ncbi:hypothetical protein [Pseudoalteromonas phage vB_PtuP_Slicky01]|nr:hypothetical protein [Pseudoalteromonas phage vB_PtuP_Slicky01]
MYIENGMLVIVEKIRTGEVIAEGVAMADEDEEFFSVSRSDSNRLKGSYYRQRVRPSYYGRLFRVTILE